MDTILYWGHLDDIFRWLHKVRVASTHLVFPRRFNADLIFRFRDDRLDMVEVDRERQPLLH